MTCRMLLLFILFILTFCVCAESFVVNVTQSVYQAKENENITMEWIIPTDSLSVFCQLFTGGETFILLHIGKGVEVPKSLDKRFSGRVQLDKDVLGEGRVRLQVSRLRTDDSGVYTCDVVTSYGSDSRDCRLHVSESFVVNVTRTIYQAKENNSITMEWIFPTHTGFSPDSLKVFCQRLTDVTDFVLLDLHKGVEVPGSLDENFAGRVQLDKDVLKEGRVRLQVSNLRISDSGLYTCDVVTSYGSDSEECRLRVSAKRDRPEPETTPSPTESPQPESRGQVIFFYVLTACLLAFLLIMLIIVCTNYRKTTLR